MAAASGSVLLLGDPSAFAASLKTLINNPQFSDVTFLVGKEKQKVFAHRCLLSTRCQVLHAMLSQPNDTHVPLILNHMQPEVFLTVIEYLYTNGVTLNNLTVLEVLTSSIEYGLNDLRKLCVEFIKDTLNVNQACEAFQAAVAYGLLDLQIYCLAFIENYTQEVTQTRGFLELSEQAMQIILQSDCLAIDEMKLIHAVREWAHVGSAVLDRTVHDMAQPVVPQLRLALLSPRELTSLEEQNKKDQMIPVESFAEAWKTHALWKRRGMQSSLCQRRHGTLPRVHHRYLDPQHK
ncbi:BTB/POZ domain-containing protein 19 [Thamnophis elegans]|uniref:BTB/POZ domain-containing protein 19 n=1 Tax=Thamnophis elegans TaxID=35005 RepID=UPI001378B044|nr:BTB/POZ domain-containing protein 19 [Thamnophis elegans]XP_032073753.1 BTB/POZ domain-containing protein 19 [Thamnophis elegans]